MSRGPRTSGGWAKPSSGSRDRGSADAWQEGERQEREAVRGPEGQGHVQGTGGADRELARRVEPGRKVVLQVELRAGRHDCPEEGGRPQGRARDRKQTLTVESAAATA